jgi:hypothetical protein
MLSPENNKLNSEKKSSKSKNLLSKIKGNLTRTPTNKKKNIKKRFSVMEGINKQTNRVNQMTFNIDMTELDSVNENAEHLNNQSKMNLSLDLNALRKKSKNSSGKTICSFISAGRKGPFTKPPIPTNYHSHSKSAKTKSLKLKNEFKEFTTNSASNKEEAIKYWKDNSNAPDFSFPIKTKNISIKGSFSSVTSLSEPSEHIKSSDEISKKISNTESQDYLIGLFLGMFFNVFGILILCCQRKRKKSIEGAVHGAVISGLVFVFMIHTIYIHKFIDDSVKTNEAIKKNWAINDIPLIKDPAQSKENSHPQVKKEPAENKSPDKLNI